MTTATATEIKLSPIQLAANEALDVIVNNLENLTATSSLIENFESLALAIQSYIYAEGKDNNKSHDELAQLANRAKVIGIFKRVGQIKNSPEFLALVDKHTPEIVVTGGNERGTVVGFGTTAQEITNAPKPPKGKGQKGRPKGSSKPSKPQKAMPTLASIEALEALDRKQLQATMSALNAHKETGVKGNGTTEAIKIALAKHLLGIDNYQPVAKAPKGSTPKEAIRLEIPEALTWDEVKGYGYRQLQALAKIFRSQGLYNGNLAGKGITKEHLLNSCADIMRGLGHDIVKTTISPINPDNAKPTLERTGVRYDLSKQATELLAA